MDVIIAGKIVSPTDMQLIIGLMVAIVAVIGFSLGMGWLFSKLYSPPKRKKAFRWISALVMMTFFSSFLLLWLLFIG